MRPHHTSGFSFRHRPSGILIKARNASPGDMAQGMLAGQSRRGDAVIGWRFAHCSFRTYARPFGGVQEHERGYVIVGVPPAFIRTVCRLRYLTFTFCNVHEGKSAVVAHREDVQDVGAAIFHHKIAPAVSLRPLPRSPIIDVRRGQWKRGRVRLRGFRNDSLVRSSDFSLGRSLPKGVSVRARRCTRQRRGSIVGGNFWPHPL